MEEKTNSRAIFYVETAARARFGGVYTSGTSLIMDLVGAGGLLLSALGVGLSIRALLKADGAQKAVLRVIEKNNDYVVRDAARDLLAKLTDARDAAMARRKGASRASSAGRSTDRDLKALEIAQDSLATVTIGSDDALEKSLRAASTELTRALATIAASSARDGWSDALVVLQGIIPRIDTLQQGLRAKSLR